MKAPAPRHSLMFPSAMLKPALAFLFLAGGAALRADPLDETYGRTFHLAPNGVLVTAMPGFRASMLSQVPGNVMPKNFKLGFSNATLPLRFTLGPLYDHINDWYGNGSEETNMRLQIQNARANDLLVSFHANAMPWGDDADQDLVNAGNFLEKYNGGALLQVDRNGKFRSAASAQDPAADEVNSHGNLCLSARNLLSRRPHRGRSERGAASGSEGVWRRGVRGSVSPGAADQGFGRT